MLFRSAYLPTQALQQGALRIEVVEGKYGKVQTIGDNAALNQTAQAFLERLSQPENQVIQSAPLERTVLILDDQPGLRATPIIRPGQTLGTGDLDVRVESTKRYTGEVGVDNHGNRYTGQNRARANLDVNSPFMLGDQITLRLLGTEQDRKSVV